MNNFNLTVPAAAKEAIDLSHVRIKLFDKAGNVVRQAQVAMTPDWREVAMTKVQDLRDGVNAAYVQLIAVEDGIITGALRRPIR